MENNNLTVDVINKIQSLVEAKEEEFQIKEVLGNTYINKDWYKINKNKPSSKRLNSLDSIAGYVKNLLNSKYQYELPVQIFASHSSIEIRSSLDEAGESIEFANATPNIPEINFDRFMSKESFVIQLQTCFVESENKTNLLKMVSTISEETKVETNDNGISQSVQAKSGTMVKDVTLPPIVELTAYRTYKEIEQPATMYLLRAKEGGQVALFEADGGNWKHEAQKRVVAYLNKKLADFIKENKVSVIG